MNTNNSVSVKHVWSLVCSRSVLDSETNNLTINNTIEQLNLPLPKGKLEEIQSDGKNGFLVPFEFEITSRFKRTATKATAFDYQIKLLAPDGKVVLSKEQKIALDRNVKNLRLRTRFNQFPVTGHGDYTIVIEIKEVEESTYEVVAEIPIEVVINDSVESK